MGCSKGLLDVDTFCFFFREARRSPQSFIGYNFDLFDSAERDSLFHGFMFLVTSWVSVKAGGYPPHSREVRYESMRRGERWESSSEVISIFSANLLGIMFCFAAYAGESCKHFLRPIFGLGDATLSPVR